MIPVTLPLTCFASVEAPAAAVVVVVIDGRLFATKKEKSPLLLCSPLLLLLLLVLREVEKKLPDWARALTLQSGRLSACRSEQSPAAAAAAAVVSRAREE